MKETLILLTGAYRFDNLIHVCKSIENLYNIYIDKFDIRWLICKDQYNGFGDFQGFIDYVNNTNINYCVIDTGKPNQKNYGGDLFNEPLKQYVSEENLNDPWVYVLDDDNIVHPRLFEIFETCINNNFYGNKQVITTINKWNCGHNREIDSSIFILPDRSNFIREWFLFDPSALIVKYSILEKYEFFPARFLYDFEWMNLKLLYGEYTNTIWYTDYDGGNNALGRHLIGSYHNALAHCENIDEYKNCNNLNLEVMLYDSSINTPLMIPVLDKETKEKIIDLIYKETEKYERKA